MEEETTNEKEVPPLAPKKPGTHAWAPFAQFIIGVFGAAAGSFLALYISINHVDRFKAEEELRAFAFTEVYQPLKDRIRLCQDIRSRAAQDIGTVHHANEFLDRYLAVAQSGGGLQALEPLLAVMKDFMETYNKASGNASLSYISIQSCQREVENAGHDLATVLKINDRYQLLLAEHARKRPSLPDFTGKENVIVRLLGDPERVSALARALQDAQAGNVARGDSALSVVRSQLAESTTASKEILDYHISSIEYGLIVEKELTELFLRDFRNRFEKMPRFTLKTLWRSIIDSEY
jgi:DNA-binding transcriptional ArsR family regulator